MDAAVHPETGDSTGAPVRLDPADAQPPAEVLAALGAAFVRSDVVIRVAGDTGNPELVGVFGGPGGAWMFRGVFGSGADIVLEPCTASALRGALRSLVQDPLGRLREARDRDAVTEGGS